MGGVVLFFFWLSDSLLELSESDELLSDPEPELEPDEEEEEPLPLEPVEELPSELDLPTFEQKITSCQEVSNLNC